MNPSFKAVTVAACLALACMPALAQEADITQTGADSRAIITQVNLAGESNIATISQSNGSNNGASILQQDTGASGVFSFAQAEIFQSGDGNTTNFDQHNVLRAAAIATQTGVRNIVQATEASGESQAVTVFQTGNSNSAYIGQMRTTDSPVQSTQFVLTQEGDNNLASISQHDGAAMTIESHQTGNDNSVNVDQSGGTDSYIFTRQTGNSNFATVSQANGSGGGNLVQINQASSFNQAFVTQTGVGNWAANVAQSAGDHNLAIITQHN